MQGSIRVNKQGQALGRKGGETRRRLLDATLDLIATGDTHKLSASRIARAAHLASQSFYLYFRDIDEVLYILSEEAAADFASVTAVVEGAPMDIAPNLLSQRLVAAFSDYWDRHRPILNVRNYLADCGNEDFLRHRFRTTMPLITSLARRMRAAQPAGTLDDAAARGRAVIIFQAMERCAARANAVQYSDDPAPVLTPSLREAAVDVLTLLLTPAPH